MILGIDVGFRAPGFCVIDPVLKMVVYASCPTTSPTDTKQRTKLKIKKSSDDVRRIVHVINELIELINTYHPTKIVCELPVSGARSAMAIKGMAMATASTVGALTALRGQADFDLFAITPSRSKMKSTEDKAAEKETVVAAMLNRWPSLAAHYEALGCLSPRRKVDYVPRWAIADAASAATALIDDATAVERVHTNAMDALVL